MLFFFYSFYNFARLTGAVCLPNWAGGFGEQSPWFIWGSSEGPPPPKSFYKNNNCIILFLYFLFLFVQYAQDQVSCPTHLSVLMLLICLYE